MHKRIAFVAAALFVAACTDAVSPGEGRVGAPLFSFASNGIQIDTINGAPTVNGSLNESGTMLAKGFDHGNPTFGDAIIATFYWVGSTFIVDSVVDFVADQNNTRAGNPFHLVEYVTAGNRSMATFVATNVRNFPERSSTSGQIYAVRAYLRESVPDGGVKISAWVGVEDNFANALGAHRSASGSDTMPSDTHAGPITVGAGGVAYTVTLSGLWGLQPPQADGYTAFDPGSDNFGLKENAAYRVFPGGGTTDPHWSWFYDQRGDTWVVTTLALKAGTGAVNQPPTAAFASSCNGLTCAFTSTSSDPDGSISAYNWNFGDGATSQVQNPSHTYTAGGTFTVTLTVTDNQNATNSVSHSVTVAAVNQPPVASFTKSCSGLTCSFTSTSSDPDGSIASYSWTFGDGGTSTAANPSHTYAAGGTYTVTLTVRDNGGASASTSQSVTVTAPNQAPVVNAGPDDKVLTGLLFTETATFTDPDNGPWTYRIDWGDGSSTTGSMSSPGTISKGHTYITILPRNFTIRVTVTDSKGASGSDTKVVSVLLL
jgi:PKD repeat protein